MYASLITKHVMSKYIILLLSKAIAWICYLFIVNLSIYNYLPICQLYGKLVLLN